MPILSILHISRTENLVEEVWEVEEEFICFPNFLNFLNYETSI